MLKALELKIPPVIVFIAALILTWYCSSLNTLPLPHPLRPLGFVIFIAGGLIGVAGVIAFRQQRTTVNPHRPQNASSLVDGGIFAYTRNPMYLGLVVGVIGAAFIARDASGFVFAVLTMAYLQRFQITPEERFMQEIFGAEFTRYCQRTNRWYGRNL
ncbi:methyltransferase family protein [Alteromonas lipolytica]|uniref:Uncharacterized protein n=1 Tax=Alteromonas lipolytica TaxID=1856405 RepID=A0A1E8FHC8_9ALTE|nr:isoprenylcysteine carboxylmethyltransferase family protein [Alteromonas lipolytica]OFI35340.1 hypothetical protein BFC17_14500 [Alteromonas lipolytica]